jgi:hypothetical protein
MSFQNSGVTPDGQSFYRGAAVLAKYFGHLLSGRVSEISESDGEVIMFLTLDTGVLSSMGGQPGQKYPATTYVGTGHRHQSTRQIRGERAERPDNLCCFAHETPNFAMGAAPGQVATTIPIEAPAPEPVGSNDQNKTAPLPTPVPERQFDSADLNRDGKTTPKEQRLYDREHRDD